ncbi:MAG: ATP-binding protein [Prolixibacteraceae bacterium]|nr:ATP-binding protein [Prolixibacteraceae bacterium]
MQTLSMIAAPIKSKNSDIDHNNTFQVSNKLTLLKSAAIYGANGSGKSNIVRAMIAMLVFVRENLKDDIIGEKIIDPFLLDQSSSSKPTFFQLSFILNGSKYRYGFEVLKNEVKSEWLFGSPDKKEVYFFTRDNTGIKINKNQFSEGVDLEDKTSSNSLFINVCKAFNGKVSNAIIDYFRYNINISAGINDNGFREHTLNYLKTEQGTSIILKMLNEADFGLESVDRKKITKDDITGELSDEIIEDANSGKLEFVVTQRPVLNEEGTKIDTHKLLMDEHESDGTRKLFNYSGAILDALLRGKTLIIDEFDARLHPLLTRNLIHLFNSPNTNKKNAQLIYVTHDTNLLDNKLLRRDQIYFTEKNTKAETELYNLVDFKGVRNDVSYEKDYIKGKYGAIPFLGNFEKLFDDDK